MSTVITSFNANKTPSFDSFPPLSLYIHFPWCEKKCPYCDFNSHTRNEAFNEQRYINSLIQDLEYELPQVWGRTIQSIFMGGGTPSLFSADAIDQLVSALRARLKLAPDCEITMEANPGTLKKNQQVLFENYKQAGITRLSIGVQSLDEEKLKSLGRIHSAGDAMAAIEAAGQAGFESFNVDLMYGLPEQTIAQAVNDLEQIISLSPSHISHYQLTIEPNTAFAHAPPDVADDDTLWQMQLECQSLLNAGGYQQYEISAYAQAGKQCRHNLNYWQYGDYLGIGAGSHQKLTLPAEQRIVRKIKQKHPATYMASVEVGEHCVSTKTVPVCDIPFEFMLNALRLIDGFEIHHFIAHTGLAMTDIQSSTDDAIARNWLEQTATGLRPTTEGLSFLNDLVALYLPKVQDIKKI